MKRVLVMTLALLLFAVRPGGSAVSGGTIIQTIAGHGGVAGVGGDGGPAVEAYLNLPQDVAWDAGGNVFISDASSNKIRRIDAASGIITTFAGDGTCAPAAVGDGGLAVAASLCEPWGLAIAPNGDVIVADAFHKMIRRISAATGVISRVAGTGGFGYSGDGGAAVLAAIAIPTGVAVDAEGNVYFADSANQRIRKVTAATGIITTVAGTGAIGFGGDGGPATLAILKWPSDVAIDPAGNLIVNDRENCRIRRVDAITGTIATVAGSGVCENPQGSNPGTLPHDRGPAISAPLGFPDGVVVDARGNIYFADGHHMRVRKVDAASGVITTVAGNGGLGFSGDNGPATAATLFWPQGLGIDRLGNLYIPDTFQNVVRKVPVDDVPLTGDLDGDGRADLLVWRPETGRWHWLTSSTGYDYGAAGAKQWGNAALGDVPLLADVDGDGRSDLVVWRASTGTWYWLTSSSGYNHAASDARQWGAQGDTALTGDVDGDGKADLMVWRASTGTWFWLTSSSGYSYAASGARQWGNQALGDVPLIGDLDGDGRTELIVWRGSSGAFLWRSATGDAAPDGRAWGNRALGDVPSIADLDGDRKGDLVVWRAGTGTWFWLLAGSGWRDTTSSSVQWGSQALADVPLLADFDGDRHVDPVVWRASDAVWYWILSGAGFAPSSVHVRQWGS